MSAGTIYGIIDPRDGTIGYIGRTKGSLTRRLRQHWCGRSNKGNRKERWFNRLDQLGVRPTICTLDTARTPEELMYLEAQWIQEMYAAGQPLTNGVARGESMYELTAETRAKIGAAHRGVPKSPEHRSKIGISNKGKHAVGHPCSDEAKAKISAANKGHKMSAEARAKMSDAGRGRKWSTKARMNHMAARARRRNARLWSECT